MSGGQQRNLEAVQFLAEYVQLVGIAHIEASSTLPGIRPGDWLSYRLFDRRPAHRPPRGLC